MEITQIISKFLDSNVFVVKKNGHALIVDCGAETEKVKSVVGDLKVDAILLTHGHYDHSVYCNEYAMRFGAKIYANVEAIKIISDGL